MHYKRKRIAIGSCLAIILTLASCGTSQEKQDENVLRVGVSSGPEYAVAEVAKQVAKDQYGLTVELVAFTDYVIPNEALSKGDIDINAFQHRPYLEEQSRQRGYNLAVVGTTFIYPIAGYSRKIKRITDLQPGSTVIIPNDPTNGGRSLLLLQKQGLLTLRNGVGLHPKVIDIVANPKNLKIMELEAPQLPRSLDDPEVALAIINHTFAIPAGLMPTRDGLFREDEKSPYVNLIVARQDNKDQQKVKTFVKAFHSAQVEHAAQKQYKGGEIKGW